MAGCGKLTPIMTNPIIAEVTRGSIVESRHRGAYAVFSLRHGLLNAVGDITSPVFPRSAVKAFQCIPVLRCGAAKAFNFSSEDIALCCASHGGEERHVQVARGILQKADVEERCLECGAHLPTSRDAANALIRSGSPALAIHNACSGKHAGMLAFAKFAGSSLHDYGNPEHPIQLAVAATLEEYCECNLDEVPCGIDGCSIPTWALPLERFALGFAKLTNAEDAAGNAIIEAVRQHPFMIAGTGQFDTKIMQAVPRLFIKFGAEGVYCGAIPHAGLGFALKCDDGAIRGAEVAVAQMLAGLDVWTANERTAISAMSHKTLRNARQLEVGEIRSARIASQIRVAD